MEKNEKPKPKKKTKGGSGPQTTTTATTTRVTTGGRTKTMKDGEKKTGMMKKEAKRKTRLNHQT